MFTFAASSSPPSLYIMVKKIISKFTHQLLLPRGKKYISDENLETGWTKVKIAHYNKQICILYKTTDIKVKGTVILSHPYLSDAKLFYIRRGHAKMYLELGFHVVIFDFNGFGESPFKNFEYESDLMIVAAHTKSMFPSLPVFGHGISFGASHTINYSTFDTNVFNKIIIENCLDSNLSYYKKRNRKLHFLMLGLMKIFPQVNKNHDYTKNIQHLKNITDVLFIYNMGDDLTTVSMGDQLFKNCKISCTIEIFEGKHLNALQENTKRYTEVISRFLDAAEPAI